MSKSYLVAGSLMASAALTGPSVTRAQADDDTYMKAAKDYIAQATAPVD